MPLAARSDWRECPDEVRPTVLIVGGFLTSPPVYRPLARRLLERGAAAVLLAPVWTPHWLQVVRRGYGPVLTRTGRALIEAGRRSAASEASRGAPVLAIGHSAGGVSLRLLTATEPFAGRRWAAAGRIGAIVTLGSPHHVRPGGDVGARVSDVASAFADRVVPGATFAPFVGYVSVASRAVVEDPSRVGRALAAAWSYRELLGPAAGEKPIAGDGLVPVRAALLDGAAQIVLDDAVHGPLSARAWYGSEDRLDHWWPTALESWHGALRARVSERGGGLPTRTTRAVAPGPWTAVGEHRRGRAFDGSASPA
jgi:hypothetical protein